jgi:hypothetical protein
MATDQRSNGYGESTLTVKWWAVIAIFLALYGWFFATALSQESRITKIETTLEVKLSSMANSMERLTCAFEKHLEQSK